MTVVARHVEPSSPTRVHVWWLGYLGSPTSAPIPLVQLLHNCYLYISSVCGRWRETGCETSIQLGSVTRNVQFVCM